MKGFFSDVRKKSRGLREHNAVYLRILGFMSAGSKAVFASSFLANLLLAQLPALMAYTTKLIIDSLLSENVASSSFAGLPDPILYGGVYLLFLLFQQNGHTVLNYVSENLTETISKNIHLEIMRTSIRLEGLAYFEDPAFYDRQDVVENTAMYLPMNFLRFSKDIFSIFFIMISMIILLSALHPLIPFLIILFGIPEIMTQKKAHRLLYEGIKESAQKERLRDYFRSVLLTEEHAKEVRIYNLKDYFIDKYLGAMKAVFAIVLPIRGRHIRNSSFTGILIATGTMLPYLWAIGAALSGSITIGELVMFTTAIVVIHQQMARTAQTVAGHQDVISTMRELGYWLQMEPQLTVPEQPVRREPSRSPLVRVEDLWFKYPGSEEFVLKGLDLEIQQGKSLAVVGRNGCGKTTLVKLLCRLFDPQQGVIRFDGVDIRRLNLDDLRLSIGIIFQDFMRYHLTVQENIALREFDDGRVPRSVSEAAMTADADAFIQALPEGYHTMLGKRFAGGVELSGGQWQRLALARGFFNDAGMLILDEPAASLDVSVEAKIYAHFKEMTQGRTALLISHRLSTVRIADEIAVIEDGKVAELGDHESLMAQGGLYAEMFTIQAERYRTKRGLQQSLSRNGALT